MAHFSSFFCNCKFILWRFIDKNLDFTRQSKETSEGSFGSSAEGRGSHLLHQLPGSRGGQAAENHPRKIIILISSHLQFLYCVNLTCSRRVSRCSSCFQLLLLWEKNSYFDDVTIQQLQSPALGLGQYQVQLVLSGLVFW